MLALGFSQQNLQLAAQPALRDLGEDCFDLSSIAAAVLETGSHGNRRVKRVTAFSH
jgi:hypothetical protein